MLVIIEGPDGGGKTTLLKTLRERLSKQAFFIQSNSKIKTTEELVAYSKFLVEAPDELTIITDRYPFFSEAVYGPLLRQKDLSMASIDSGEASKIGVRDNSLVIYCRPPWPTLKRNLENEPQRKGVKEKILFITKKYDTIIEEVKFGGVPVIQYDYSRCRPGDLTYIIEQIQGKKS